MARKVPSAKKSYYFKPFVRTARARSASLEKYKPEVLAEAGKAGLKAVRAEIRLASWKRTPKRLIRSFSYTVGDNTVSIRTNHPAAHFMDKGVHTHQMSYLMDRTVPIIADTGEVIFRRCTAKTLADGSWIHPGIRAKNFISRGMRKARLAMQKIFQEETIKQLRHSMEWEVR